MKEKAREVGAGDLLEASGWLWVEISLTANVTKAGVWLLERGLQGLVETPQDQKGVRQGEPEVELEGGQNGEM